LIKQVFIILGIVIIAAGAACLQESENPIGPTGLNPGALTVDLGFTVGEEMPLYGCITGEYAAFTMRWTEVENAQYYEIRANEEPITPDNWHTAIPLATVPAPADTSNIFLTIEVQEEPCIGCGLCEQVCHMGAITVQNGVAVIDYDRCTACGRCQDVCPVEAISGARVGTNYFFGIRAFFSNNNPDASISVTDEAYRIIYYSNHVSYDPTNKSCGLCPNGVDSLGYYAGCHIINDYYDAERNQFTGYGCPVDAVWQDTLSISYPPLMIYIDYDKCINCGICFVECWNYKQIIDPGSATHTPYHGMKSTMHRVVSESWVTDQPTSPY